MTLLTLNPVAPPTRRGVSSVITKGYSPIYQSASHRMISVQAATDKKSIQGEVSPDGTGLCQGGGGWVGWGASLVIYCSRILFASPCTSGPNMT